MSRQLCDGTCISADLDGLTAAELAWLWDGIAVAADRRGDPTMDSGTTTVTAPDEVAARAAAAGLLGRRHLTAGQRVRVDVTALAATVAPLTPGAVAAHVVGRRLAQRHAARAARADNEATLRSRLEADLPDVADDEAWVAFKRSGWVTRALAAPPEALDAALAVIARLPGDGDPPVDRRVLAQGAAQNPHALDRGELVGGIALALLTATERVPTGANAREAWGSVGVTYDDITGGLTVLRITPAGWDIPKDAPVTVPPRVLADCTWPEGARPVFVTENPSVLSAAVDITGARVICTSGTPSAVEVAALARLADGAATVPLRVERLSATPWDPPLAGLMAQRRVRRVRGGAAGRTARRPTGSYSVNVAARSDRHPRPRPSYSSESSRYDGEADPSMRDVAEVTFSSATHSVSK